MLGGPQHQDTKKDQERTDDASVCLVRRSGVLATGQDGEPTPGDNPKVIVNLVWCDPLPKSMTDPTDSPAT